MSHPYDTARSPVPCGLKAHCVRVVSTVYPFDDRQNGNAFPKVDTHDTHSVFHPLKYALIDTGMRASKHLFAVSRPCSHVTHDRLAMLQFEIVCNI